MTPARIAAQAGWTKTFSAQPRQSSAQNGARGGADEYQNRGSQMLDAKDHCQRHRACPGCEREEPCGSWRRPRDCVDRRRCGVQREPTGFGIRDRLHRGSHTTHVDARRIGRHLPDQTSATVVGFELQGAPARGDLDTQSRDLSDSLRRSRGLVRGLAVDVENAGKSEHEVATLLRCHATFIRYSHLSAHTPCRAGATLAGASSRAESAASPHRHGFRNNQAQRARRFTDCKRMRREGLF